MSESKTQYVDCLRKKLGFNMNVSNIFLPPAHFGFHFCTVMIFLCVVDSAVEWWWGIFPTNYAAEHASLTRDIGRTF